MKSEPCQIIIIFLALTEIFTKADSSGNGKISMEDYRDICDEYGIAVSEEEMKNIAVNIFITGLKLQVINIFAIPCSHRFEVHLKLYCTGLQLP